MKTFKQVIINLFLILIIASTFFNSINPLRPLFYREGLYVSIFSGIFVVLILFLAKFKVHISINFIDILLLIFYCYVLFNLLLLNQQSVFGEEFISFTMLMITYFILKHYYENELHDIDSSKNGLIISIYSLNLIPIVIGILELSGVIPLFNTALSMCGGLKNQGAFANYLGSLVPFSYTILLLDKNKTRFIKVLSWITLVLSLIIIIIAKSRSAWIACAVSFLYITLVSDKISILIRRISLSKLQKILLISLSILILLVSSYSLYHFKKNSADGRILVWKNCFQLIKETPLFGHGYNSFVKIYNNRQIEYFKLNPNDIENGMLADNAVFAFNDYLQLVTEIGIVGLGLFLLVLFFVFYKTKPHPDVKDNGILLGSKACILSMLACALFSYPFEIVQNYFLVFLFLAYISTASIPIFKIQGITRNIVILFIITIISFVGYYHVRKFAACSKWEKAYIYAENKEFSTAYEIYESIYPMLKNDPFFLFNYGTILSDINEYEKSVLILESSKKRRTSYDLFLNLGRAYEGAGKDSLAEQNYKQAAFLIPHRFVPRQLLFKLYQRTNQLQKAEAMAKIISNMQIKVYSLQVGDIKNEAVEYLGKNDGK